MTTITDIPFLTRLRPQYAQFLTMESKRRKTSKKDIILVDLNPVRGSEQSGIRPCIIIQNDYANAVARTFVVAIIPTVIKEYPHMIVVDPSLANGLRDRSRIDCFQIRTIDQDRIIEKWGALESKNQKSLDEAICVAFGV